MKLVGVFIFAFNSACFLAIPAEKARYDGYRVFKVVPQTTEQLNLLNLMRQATTDLNFWNEPRKVGSPVMIMVPPHARSMFKNFLDESGLTGVVTIPDVQKTIDEQERHRSANTKAASFWEDYHDLNEINQWLLEQEGNRLFNVSRIVVGQTYKGKNIYGLKISKSSSPDLPGVILESGIHAREWIAPAATSWMINEILNDYDENSVWHQFQYIYIPTLNPDGYEYTFTDNRLWRKTLKPYGVCIGADPNRNWDTHWMSIGASSSPCDETFAGPHPFSETETKTVSDFYRSLSSSQPDLYDIYIAFHSFSQMLMYPWGYTGQSTPLTPIWDEVAGKAVQALSNVHGTQFIYGNIHDTIRPASGSSIEYYYDKYNSTLTYAFELRDTGKHGFLLPADQIIPSGEELEAAVGTILNSYLELRRSQGKIFSSEDSITDHRIINGKKAEISEVPYHVGVYPNGRYKCGGSIISKNFVLTAAHCVHGLRLPCDKVTIRTASHLRDEGGVLYTAKKIIVHPKYSFPLNHWDYDVALIELEDPICCSNKSRPIMITDVEPSAGETLQVTGWGYTEDGIDSNERLAVDIPVTDWSTCKKKAEEDKILPEVTSRTICGNGTHWGGCSGDNGSPVTRNGKQVGIVSGGSLSCKFINAWTNIAHEEIMNFIRRNSDIDY